LVGGNAVSEHARGIEFDANFAIDAAEARALALTPGTASNSRCKSLSMNQEMSWGVMPSPSMA
jgi:hypothetical protein